MTQVLVGLFLVGLLAGFVDAIAGGGGLLTVPALWLAGLDPQLALGTNKGQSVFGSGTALQKYWRSPLLHRRRAMQSFLPALAGGAGGVLLLSHVPTRILTPLVMTLLAAVAGWTLLYRAPMLHEPSRQRSAGLAVLVAFVIAFYDGFFGPGTGTFLIMAYALLWRDSLDAASANAKVVNFASNLASMVMFACKGWIVVKFAAPMAVGQIIGGYAGAHLTIRGGKQVVRYAVVLISIALVIRLGWKVFGVR